MKVRATLIELWKKITPFKPTDDIYFNGDDNNYSEEMELVVSNSPTGARARDMFGKYIYGDGIPEDQNPKLDSDRYLSEVVKDVIDDVVVQYGAFIHTSYGLEVIEESGDIVFLPKTPKSLDYNKCRISSKDDDGNDGMILYKNFNKLEKSLTPAEKKAKRKYYPFNPNQKVVKAQIESDAKAAGYEGDDWKGKLQHYRGQVMYLNLTPKYRYAISKFDSVYNDLDTEYRIGVYCNTMTRGGFLGKMAVLTKGLDEEESEKISEDIQKWLGAEGSSSLYHLDVEQAESLDDVLKIIQVDSQFDHKQFETIRKALRINILGAANNLPEGLVFSNDGSLFDGSGEKYREMKQFYWEQCSWEREKIEEAFYKLGHNFNFKPFENGNSTITE